MKMGETLWNIFACELLAQRVDILQKLTAGNRPVDSEYIHDVRVASRRFKEALRAFRASIEPDKARQWQKTIKTMLTALGNARDVEVQRGILHEFLDRHKTLKKDAQLNQLVAELEKRHYALERKAYKAIERFEKTGVLREINRFLKEKASAEKGSLKRLESPTVYRQIAQIVAQRMIKVRKYGRFAGQPQRQMELHQLRLGLKRLRYTLELFTPVYGSVLDESIKTAARLQQSLGDMHDSAVWLDNLTGRMSELSTTKGVRSFYQAQEVVQRSCYEDFLAIWTQAKTRKTWTRMRQAINIKNGNAGKE
jgi:CHAD domain-containing protein